ncbi:ABC transporter permease [Mucilaginibacter pocheonensis]|uniref:ABC transport system permease protein n=1 Tax=Mucilaginibacter pocheonensis TaxID=398050 RepID=A0ABU1TFZ8_9SPHI|nr:ABC transporter permease [Mucilaginibacter pocheonensis]MDR6944350.1 putative ABC transport system permease protein [Mucilaginibacter pocheonensis]
MIKHLFKLIWNKKKQNFLLITEMFISFLVIFGVFASLVYYYRNYKKPMGFTYDNVWVINYQNAKQFHSTDSVLQYYATLVAMLKNMPQIKALSFASGNVPFTSSINTTGLNYKGRNLSPVNFYQTGDGYRDAFNLNLLEGRWFNQQDQVSTYRPVVINAALRERLFGNGRAVGQLINDNANSVVKKIKIIGVVQDMKDKGDYLPSGMALYNRIDTGAMRYMGQLIIKVSPNADAAFESKLYKTVASYMKDASVEIEHFSKKRENTNKSTLIPIIILCIIAGFLIINVALGLFGVLWYNINRRRGEIGLRRAVGATGSSVSAQLIQESMILATFALIIGTFFAVQFPILNVFDIAASTYIIAIVLAVLFIYLLVFLCSLYPGKQAAAIYPAVALHEE